MFGRRSAQRRGMIVGASIASSRARKQQAAQPAAQTPAATSVDTSLDVAQLKALADLRDQGILTQEEFDAKKKQILGL